MGTRGPVPKRSADRIGHANKAGPGPDQVKVNGAVSVPRASGDWHPRARAMYDALKAPELSRYMLAADWAYAQDAAETLTLAYETKSSEMFKVAQRKWDTIGLLTEAGRRRAGIEIEREAPEAPQQGASDHRTRLTVVGE